MPKVLIATPCYDGRTDVWFNNSLNQTIKIGMAHDIDICPVYISYDSMVHRARNDYVKIMLESDFDAFIFIDSDEEWDPTWIFQLLSRPEDVVAAVVVKKSDQVAFNVKALPEGLRMLENGLMEVAMAGTGFMKISREALQAVWDISTEYTNEGKTCRMVFESQVIDGELISEDNVFCARWRGLGGKVFIDPSMTVNHIGVKKYSGNFLHFLEYLKTLEEAANDEKPMLSLVKAVKKTVKRKKATA